MLTGTVKTTNKWQQPAAGIAITYIKQSRSQPHCTHPRFHGTTPTSVPSFPPPFKPDSNLRPHAGQSLPRDFWDMLISVFLGTPTSGALSVVDSRHQALHCASAQKCHSPFPPNHREPQIFAHQKVITKALAISA